MINKYTCFTGKLTIAVEVLLLLNFILKIIFLSGNLKKKPYQNEKIIFKMKNGDISIK